MRICKVCGGSDNRTLYALTARSKAIQNEWIEFIDRVHGRSMWQQDNVHLCHHHFSDSSFVNKFAYDRGFVQRLALQKNALPTILKNVPSSRGNSSHLGETVEISENLSSSNSMSTTLVQDFHDPQESSTNHYHYEPTVTMTIPGVDEEVRNRMVELAKQLDISLGKLLQLLLDLYCREFQQFSLPGPSEPTEASDICTPVLFKEEEEADIEDPPMEVPDILHVPSPTTILEPASVPHDLDPDHEGPSIPPRKLHRTEKKYPHLSENSVQLHWTPNHESQVKTDIDIQVKRKHGMETELRYQPSKDTEINHQPSIGTVLKYEPHRGTKSIPQPDLDAESRYQPGMTAEIKRSSCVPHHKHKTGFEPINSGPETADICEDGDSEHG